jgi:O-antigen/teichoic acid export membrane protein
MPAPISPAVVEMPHAESVFAAPAQADVTRLARRGFNWSLTLLLGRYLFSMGSTAFLSRLLSPSDYGLMGMVAAITALAQASSDFGLSWAMVQRAKITRNEIDALLLINTGFGLFLMVLCVLSAPYVATFYHRPELTKIMIAASTTLLLSAIAVQPTALMRRQMKLKEISLCTVWGLSVSSIVAILLARSGFGYWALVVQMVLQQAIITALSFPLSGYFPGFPRHFLGLRSFMTFGGYSASYGIVNYFSRNLDNVLVGKFWGATALGYYARAYFLMTLPAMLVMGAFAGVLIPAMASLRDEPIRMELVYIRALRLITVLGSGLALGLAATASELVEVVYGPRWRAVVPILLWLSVASVVQPIQNTAQWLYIVANRGRGMFGMGILVSGTAVLAFAIGIHSGPVGVARAYAIANTIVAYPVLLLGHRVCRLDIKKTLSAITPLLFCSLVMGSAVYLVGLVSNLASIGLHLRLLLKVIVGVAVYAVCLRRYASSTYSDLASYLPSFTTRA